MVARHCDIAAKRFANRAIVAGVPAKGASLYGKTDAGRLKRIGVAQATTGIARPYERQRDHRTVSRRSNRPGCRAGEGAGHERRQGGAGNAVKVCYFHDRCLLGLNCVLLLPDTSRRAAPRESPGADGFAHRECMAG